jgi:dGTPase
MRQNDAALKDFLFRHVYRHERVNRMTARAGKVVRDLFALYMEAPAHLPEEWRTEARGAERARAARLVADYIAGMTDRFALEEHRKLFGSDGKI